LKSGDQATTTEWVDLTGWATPSVISGDFTFADGEVSIVLAGTYNLNLWASTVVASEMLHQLEIKLLKNGTDIPGAEDRQSGINLTGFYSSENTPTTTKKVSAQINNFILPLAAGDKIKAQVRHIETAGTIGANNARMAIIRQS
jgi:hypothetical protein